MVFCVTRKSTVSTAKLLANWWLSKGARERQWAGPTFRLVARDPDLKETLTAAVAFHHAGLDASDRQAIEKGFLEGQVNVICCTSTLAVGVNLPCHMVIIKNTMGFQDEGHNPPHYKLDGDAASLNLDDRIEGICQRDIDLLLDAQLVTTVGDKIKCTEFGDAMARYYVKFETMKGLLSLEPRSKMSDILSVLVGAEEFHDIRYRATEKKLLKDVNAATGIKYPIKVDIALSQHKRSLIIQAELGGVDFPADEQYTKFSRQFQQDKNVMFNHIHRLIRCVIDCQVYLQDAVTVRHALELARSFAARVWDNSPYQMKQVPNIGPAAVRRLANGGINSIESLEATEPHKIEMLMSKHPPFGTRILASLKDYPKLRVSIKMMGKDVKPGQAVKIKVRAEVGFMNEKAPTYFHRKAVYVCFLAERSDGHLVDFRRISAGKFTNEHDILLSVELLQHTQHVTCYVMCDEIGCWYDAVRRAQTKSSTIAVSNPAFGSQPKPETPSSYVKQQLECRKLIYNPSIDTFETDTESKVTQKHARSEPRMGPSTGNDQDWAPTQLANGKWACNHKCKDKTACKHLCCHEGVDKPPKAPRKPTTAANSVNSPYPKSDSKSESKQKNVQTKLQMGKPAMDQDMQDVETVDLAHTRTDDDYVKVAPRAYRSLHQLHQKVNRDSQTSAAAIPRPSFSYKKGDQPKFTFLSRTGSSGRHNDDPSSDYGSGWMDDLPSPSALLQADGETDSGLKATDAAHDKLASHGYDSAAEDLGLDHVGDSEKQARRSQSAGEPMDSTVFADNQYDEAVGNLGSDGLWEASPKLMDSRFDDTSQVAKEQKLFMSTDSPEKPSSPPAKRRYTESFRNEPDEVNSTRVAKRGKQLDTVVQGATLQRSPSGEKHNPEPAVPIIKPGYPDWVTVHINLFAKDEDAKMGRLNYTNRKTEGLKLGQTIAKDLTKRIPPGTGSKSALRDPIVELDVTGKFVGRDGFKELAAALIKSLEHDDGHGRVCQLEELCLKANILDTTCLPALARIVRLAAHDLRDLDLSDNCFSITSNRDADVWEDFLESFAECYMLRRLDFSGNVLGPKAFEVIARVYSRARLTDHWSEDSFEIPSPTQTPRRTSISGTADSLDRQTRKLSLGSALEEYSDDDEHASITKKTAEHGTRHDSKSPEKSSLPDQVDIYSRAQGLRSVPYLIFYDTEMTDAGALHLSYIISCHHHPDRLLRYVPPARSSQHIQQLDVYDHKTGCHGIIYLPNENVSSPCLKLLELCEGARFSLLDDDRPAASSEAFHTHVRKTSSGRKTSTTYSSHATIPAGARRRSGTKGKYEDLADSQAVYAELDRARSRIQGNVLKDVGPRSNDLWRTALQMLGLCRMLCPLRNDDPPPPTAPVANERNHSSAHPVDFPTLPKANGRPFVGYLDPFAPPPAAKNPNMPNTPKAKKQAPKLKTATPSPLSITTSPTTASPGAFVLPSRPYRSHLPFALPEEAWARIMGLHVGADRFMSTSQQRNVLRWAIARRTLAKELESLGKPESAQIWKVLDGMGCLAYEG
ncbi:MAG: hypothetical protein Q9196_004190 [Gyalolechia fulgens]